MKVISYNQAAERANLCRRSFEREIALGTGPAIIEVSNLPPRRSRIRLRSLALVPPAPGAGGERQGRVIGARCKSEEARHRLDDEGAGLQD